VSRWEVFLVAGIEYGGDNSVYMAGCSTEVISVWKRHIVRNLAGLRRLMRYGAGKAARVGVAVIYLFVTVSVPLNHDCVSDATWSGRYHSINSNNCCDEHSRCGAEEASFEGQHSNSEGKFVHGACLACMYSATAKTHSSAWGVSFLIYEGESKVQIPKDSGLAKSFGWLCSHPLRGPPDITS
jgi:hypothetical protein